MVIYGFLIELLYECGPLVSPLCRLIRWLGLRSDKETDGGIDIEDTFANSWTTASSLCSFLASASGSR
jgi:hypothetical protein